MSAAADGPPPPPPPPPAPAGEPDPLHRLRQQIDALDAKIVDLLNDRAKIVVEIGRIKQAANFPIYAPDREKAVLDKVRRLNRGPLHDRCLEAVYRELMSGSFALERPLRIGYLGPAGGVRPRGGGQKVGRGRRVRPPGSNSVGLRRGRPRARGLRPG